MNKFTSGGTSPIKYSIDNGTNFSDSNKIGDLPAGTYHIITKDIHGCYQNDSVIIQHSNPNILDSVSSVPDTCSASRGRIEIMVSNGKPPYKYSINNGSKFFESNIFNNICEGSYSILVKDSGGCESSEKK